MKKIGCLVALSLLLFTCRKSENSRGVPPGFAGIYMGIFHRTGMDTVQVSISFLDDNTFRGSGGRANYPAICRGQYALSGNSLMIGDQCNWTADFDWSLIFNGNYTIDFTGQNGIRIWRTSAGITDEYVLGKLAR